MDWLSKRILSWRPNNTLDRFFVLEALEEALRNYGDPDIVNGDHGSQYVGDDYIGMLEGRNTKISMTGKVRALGSHVIERFWRTLKIDEVYMNDCESIADARQRMGIFIERYNSIRPHASRGGLMPDMLYWGTKEQGQAI
jgi:putative transposase